MTLKEMKIKTFSLIEEYYPDKKGLADDEDVLNKINGVVNSIMYELCRIKKIPAKYTLEITEKNNPLLIKNIPNIYQLNKIIGLEYDIIGDYEIEFKDDNKFIVPVSVDVYYYKYPEKTKLTFGTDEDIDVYDNEFVLELDEDVLETMTYGVAADLLKNDMITNYGRYFYERYQALKQELDTRVNMSSVIITGGIDI